MVPLKNKKGETVTQAFKTIFKEGRKPQYLWTDKGKEYYNKHMKELLEKNGITLHSTEDEEKSSVCKGDGTVPSKQRRGSSLLSRVILNFSVCYQKYLSSIKTPNSSIKMTPVEASKKNESTVYFNLYGNMEQSAS